MSRIRRRTAVVVEPWERPPLGAKEYGGGDGRGDPFRDAWPYPGDDAISHRAILAEQLRRDRELTDLPDISADAFGSVEEYAEWLAAGAQRFSA